jgi:hypothetical protein
MRFRKNWHAPKLLDRLKCESEMEIAEGEGVGAHSLTRNTSKAKGCVEASKWD